jgi:hypothetical protein
MAIWHNLWLLGKVCGHLLYFSQFGMLGPRKIWQPCLAGFKACKSCFEFPLGHITKKCWTEERSDGRDSVRQNRRRFSR